MQLQAFRQHSRFIGKERFLLNNIMPMGHQGMVASPHYMASTVGSFVLREGGNAFDAAVAVSATLAVVYPHMTGIGGDSFFLMYSAKDRKVIGLNGSGRSGREVSSSLFKDKGLSRIPDRGVLSAITVPGMVDAWWEVWTRFGRLPWDKLIAPAVQYAEQGFPVSRDLYRWMCKDEQWIREDKTLKEVFMDGGRLKKRGFPSRSIRIGGDLASSDEGRKRCFL